MEDTNINAFTVSCARYVHFYILQPIVKHLSDKNIQVTVDELSNVLKLPCVTNNTLPPVHGMMVPGAVPKMRRTTKKKSTNAVEQAIPGKTCMYQFKRGDPKGLFCGKSTVNGNKYCNTCMGVRTSVKKELAANSARGIAPNMGAIPELTGASKPEEDANVNLFRVTSFDAKRNLYRDPVHQFILYNKGENDGNNSIAVIGKFDEKTQSVVALSPDEIKIAEDLSLIVSDDHKLLSKDTEQPNTGHGADSPGTNDITESPIANNSSMDKNNTEIPQIPDINMHI